MVLIMTGTIDSDKFGNVSTVVSDASVRLEQYSLAIERYIKESHFNRIIFAENSGYDFDYDYFERMAGAYGKSFEFLPVVGDSEKMKKYGKSYGEANLIASAVNYIGDSEEIFYKVTGRVWVKNINKILASTPPLCHLTMNSSVITSMNRF